MTWIKHNNPTNNLRVSSAAYNFVELPDKIVKAVESADNLPNHNTFSNSDYPNTGHFIVKLTTKTPLYVRSPLTPNESEEKAKQEEKIKRGEAINFREKLANKPNFFYTNDSNKESSATIPGSSLRGMLRNLLEIVSYSKVENVTRKRLFFRSLDNSSLGDEYRTKRMKNIETGFWNQNGQTYSIEKCCVAKVFQYPFFDRDCIQDAVGLLRKIDSANDSVSKLIKEKLGDKALKKEKQKFEEFSRQTIFGDDDLKKLKSVLRQILDYVLFDRVKRGEDDKKLTADNRFDEFNLPDELKRLVNQNQNGEKAIQRNRILLEAVYPDEIEKSVANRTISSLFGNGNFVELYKGNGANATPKWEYQHHKIYLPKERVEQIAENSSEDVKNFRVPSIDRMSLEKTDEFSVEGVLVLTGSINSKKRAFIFFEIENAEKLSVPNDLSEEDSNKHLVNRFNDDDQLTKWQQEAFPKNKPENDSRKRNGLLKSGEPVFFLREGENNKLSFFGRARMFRLPYLKTPFDFVPSDLRQVEQVDFAEAMFGFTKKEGIGKSKAYSSRVFISDATLKPNQTDIFLHKIEPSILASPKPTAFQHYLVQTTDVKDDLFHYGNNGKTVIRGHKLYWHRGKVEANDLKSSEVIAADSKQHTQFTPVKSETTFEFKVYFENLSNEELGALCWILKPQGKGENYYQKLGMGKAFGMGAVHLEADLYLENRVSRYTNLFDESNWNKGKTKADLENWKCFSSAFEKKILVGIQSDKETLSEVERIEMLLKMLEWTENIQNAQIKRTLTLEEFKERQILPNPLYDFNEEQITRPQVSHTFTIGRIIKKPN